MGCDIHMYVEHRRQNDDYWFTFGGRINPGRDYELFGVLAGVRGGEAIYQPRGKPEKTGYEADGDWWLWIVENGKEAGDGGSTEEDAARWVAHNGCVYRKTHDGARNAWVSHPDWHTPSWLTLAELEDCLSRVSARAEYRALLAAMRVLEEDGSVSRVVFWFDN